MWMRVWIWIQPIQSVSMFICRYLFAFGICDVGHVMWDIPGKFREKKTWAPGLRTPAAISVSMKHPAPRKKRKRHWPWTRRSRRTRGRLVSFVMVEENHRTAMYHPKPLVIPWWIMIFPMNNGHNKAGCFIFRHNSSMRLTSAMRLSWKKRTASLVQLERHLTEFQKVKRWKVNTETSRPLGFSKLTMCIISCSTFRLFDLSIFL